jgi:serine phosphatase RsbU (regulator of sigma subunit)
LYIEGMLIGVLMALVIFAWFNAIQNKDRTNLFYAIWISSAFLSIFTIGIMDGERLFEFFIDLEGLRAANTETYGYTVMLFLAFSQSILYVLFARQYLGIQRHFPKIYILSNLWVMFALLHGYLSLSGRFYVEDPMISAPNIAMAYGISVAVMLITLFVCSFLRYRAGFGFAVFFSFAIFPYLIFRTNFLLGIIGIPSLFSYLPDHAFGYFLKNPWTNQAFGVCLEAMIMGMAVFSRTRWLQKELTVSAQKQTELIEKQNLILEDTVAQRTRELSAKHEVVVSSVNYASRLQRGQLPRQLRIEGRFASFATIWEPRDTIGGDTFWLSSSQTSGPFVLAVADCTGHGVPGAMLSLLVSNSLERIYANDTREDPATALMSLDHYVRTGLNQDRPDSESDDGCDAAVLRIDRERHTIEFASAKLALFQVSVHGVLTRHAGSRCSLGYQDAIPEADRPLLKTIHGEVGDVFAVVTDGFTDQIGGASGKTSYGYRRLEAILKAHCKASAHEIATAMKQDFAQWQGNNARRDDVTAVVFRL